MLFRTSVIPNPGQGDELALWHCAGMESQAILQQVALTAPAVFLC
jgi:hypothetical protein